MQDIGLASFTDTAPYVESLCPTGNGSKLGFVIVRDPATDVGQWVGFLITFN